MSSKKRESIQQEQKTSTAGKLYLCATPIGNLDDITFRLIKTLKQVDLIAAEDTRRSIKILNHLEIEKPMVSYHEHNKMAAGPKLIEKMLEGQQVALVSDAGMPAISDPGEDLVKMAIENGIEIECIDGPVAAIHALVLSGFSTRRFAFEGFVERQSKDRRKQFEALQYDNRTLIFYEAPHRLKDFLKDAFKVLGNRRVAICRELTKRFEEILRMTLDEALTYFETHEVKGEFVVILEGFEGDAPKSENVLDLFSIEEELQHLIAAGHSKKDAIAMTATRRGLPKKEVYSVGINI